MGASFLGLNEVIADPIGFVPVAFGEWLPDLPARNNPGALEALNVIPSEGCYTPFATFGAIDGATVPEAVRGAASIFTESDIVRTYAGTLNGIYAGTTSFTNVYASPPLYNDYAWQFVQVGEQVVAIHSQVIPVAAPSNSITAFTVVGGSPPMAGCGAHVNEFLMLGNLLVDPDDGGDAFPSRIRWGGFNNIDAPWVSDPATQSDFQDMPSEGGAVIAIVGRRSYANVYQSRSISRASYVGLPTVFDIETVEHQRGALARDAVVSIGALDFFPAEDGFYIFNGINTSPIGNNKVDRYFLKQLAYSARSRMVGAVDFANSCIVWAFPTDSSGNLNELIIYSYRENRWTHSIQTLEYLFTSGVSSAVLDDLLGDLDLDYPISFDDSSYRGGRPFLTAFNLNHNYGLFNGAAMAATIDTGEYEGPEGRRIFVNCVRPDVDMPFPTATIQVAQRDQLIGDPLNFTAAVAQEASGECPIMAEARLLRFRMSLPAGAAWRHATGVDVMRKATGKF